MNKHSRIIRVVLAWFLALAWTPAGPQSIERACSTGGRIQDARVRVAWTEIATVYDGVTISYCVLRGDRNARLDFERDADIVYFGLAGQGRELPRLPYVFTIKTSAGRVVRQGPALLQPVARQPHSCRVEVCQFFTNPGERVVSVSVLTEPGAHRR